MMLMLVVGVRGAAAAVITDCLQITAESGSCTMSSFEAVAQVLEPLLKWLDPYTDMTFAFMNDVRLDFNQFCSRLEAYELTGLTVILTLLLVSAFRLVTRICSSDESAWKRLKSNSFRLLIKLPIIRSIASREIAKTVDSLKSEMMKPFAGESFRKDLPVVGLTPEEVVKLMNHYQSLGSVEWRSGRVSGGVYAAMSDKKLHNLMRDVFEETAYTNPLHADIFPGVRKMESEVVRMAISLFRGDEKCCGTMTSGGTESLVMACKAFRNFARAERGVEFGEIIAPVTAHAGFDKAAELLGMKLRHVPCDPKTWKVDVRAMKRMINRNTVLLIGSSPSYPHGIIDPLDEIAKLGLAYDIPVHVDACLGGFLLPFMSEAGYAVPVFDFSVPGICSISADTHKYGYAPKGSSVILYRDVKYRHHQFSVCTDWPGGMYASPTISGSRAGANIATCWASLLYHGRDGYVHSTRLTLQVTRFLKQEVKKIPGLFVFGDPLMSVLAFGSDSFNILDMSERLAHRGWNLNPLQFPSGFHICVTLMHTRNGIAEQLLQDMREVAAELIASPSRKSEGQAAVYGMAQALPDRSMVGDIAKHYLDAYYNTN